MLPVGPTGEVELEAVTGEPSVDDVLPVGTGRVDVYVVPDEMVVTLPEYVLLETPVGPGKLDVLLMLYPVPVPVIGMPPVA